MTAWTRLLAASSLAIGTAWDLITHPKTGGSGTVIVNGATIALEGGIAASLAEPGFAIALDTAGFAASIQANPITVSLAPDMAAQITSTDIGATA